MEWTDVLVQADIAPVGTTQSFLNGSKVKKTKHAHEVTRAIDSIPPTKDAFVQPVKRAVYQGAFIWEQLMVLCPDIPNASNWGWQKQGDT